MSDEPTPQELAELNAMFARGPRQATPKRGDDEPTPQELAELNQHFSGEKPSVRDQIRNAPVRPEDRQSAAVAGPALGFASTATGGFLDEIYGANRAVARKLGSAARGVLGERIGGALGLENEPRPFGEVYREGQQAVEGLQMRNADINPVGTTAGSLAALAVPVGATAATASTAARLAAPVVKSAVMGFGSSSGNLDSPEGVGQLLVDTGKGALLGTVPALARTLGGPRAGAAAGAPAKQPTQTPRATPKDPYVRESVFLDGPKTGASRPPPPAPKPPAPAPAQETGMGRVGKALARGAVGHVVGGPAGAAVAAGAPLLYRGLDKAGKAAARALADATERGGARGATATLISKAIKAGVPERVVRTIIANPAGFISQPEEETEE